MLTFNEFTMSVVEQEGRVRSICRIRLPEMDQLTKINECVAQTQNKYCFKYHALFCVTKPNFANATHRKLLEKKVILLNLASGPIIALVCVCVCARAHTHTHTDMYILSKTNVRPHGKTRFPLNGFS